jgi:hypothetical protein
MRRPPATGLDDTIVEAVIVLVVQRLGYLDIPLACALLDAVRRELGGFGLHLSGDHRARRRGHLQLVEPFAVIELAAIVCPSGAA